MILLTVISDRPQKSWLEVPLKNIYRSTEIKHSPINYSSPVFPFLPPPRPPLLLLLAAYSSIDTFQDSPHLSLAVLTRNSWKSSYRETEYRWPYVVLRCSGQQRDQHVPNRINMWNVLQISGWTINHKLMGVISMGISTVANVYHTGYWSMRLKLELDRQW